MRTQREVLLICLKYARHKLTKHDFAGIYYTGIKCKEIDKVIEDIENFRAEFGTIQFTTCQHKGHFYHTWFGERYYCENCQQIFKGDLMRELLK